MTDAINRTEAARLFLERVIIRAHDGVIKDKIASLKDPSYLSKPSSDDELQSRWFDKLDQEGQSRVQELVRKVVRSAVFGCLVVLDNATGGEPLSTQSSDFALYLQVYKNEDELWKGEPIETVRLNHLAASLDIHDLFVAAVEQA